MSKLCKKCSEELILTDDKKTSNVTPSEYKRSNGKCKECSSIVNSSHRKPKRSKDDKMKDTHTKKVVNGTYKRISLDDLEPDIHNSIRRRFVLQNHKHHIKFYAQYILPEKVQLNIDIPTAIQSVMGTGKTKYVLEAIKQAKEDNKTITYVCPNISTIVTTQKEIENAGYTVYNYKAAKQAIKYDISLVTVDSYNKIDSSDILIIDEVFSVFEEMGMKYNNINTITSVLKYQTYGDLLSHPKVIMLDRYIQPVINLFDCFQKDYMVIENTYKKEKKEISVQVNGNLQDTLREIVIMSKQKKVLIQSTEKGQAQKISELLVDNNITHNLKTADDGKNISIEEFDLNDVKIANSIISRGVNLTSDEVYLIDSGRSLGVISTLQMLDRARNSVNIHLKIENGNIKDKVELLKMYEGIKSEQNNRIAEFLRMGKFVEEHHKETLTYLIKDTYIIK